MLEVTFSLVTTISPSEQIQISLMNTVLINSTSVTGSMEVEDILVSETIILLTSSMYPELVHSQDSVSLQEYQQDMFSRLMHQEMLVGKQLHQDDLVGDSLVTLEPIHSHSSSEPQIIRISYSDVTILRHSVSLEHQGIL